MSSGHTFKFLILFEFIIYCEKVGQFDSFAVSCPVFSVLLIERLSFVLCIFLPLCRGLIDHVSVGSFLGPLFCPIDRMCLFLCQYHTI